MENYHRNVIREQYPTLDKRKVMVCLYIDDIHEFNQPELIMVLKEKFEDAWRRGLLN